MATAKSLRRELPDLMLKRLAALSLTLIAFVVSVPVASAADGGLTGVLETAVGDNFASGQATTSYVLQTADGVRAVNFSGQPDPALLGHVVRATKRSPITAAADGTMTQRVSLTGLAESAPSYSSGHHKVAVVLFNWLDNATEPYTTTTAQNVVFDAAGSAANYYNEVSWGQLTMSGDVWGWYTLPSNKGTTCDYSGWATAASAAAKSHGFVVSDYDNVVYAFPSNSACGWTGLAYMPGMQSWANGSSGMSLQVIGHELGHNFGANHASAIKCSKDGQSVALVADESSCTFSEYADPFSIMGNNATRDHSGYALSASLGWIPPSGVTTVSGDGDYTITPLETKGGHPVLRIARGNSSFLSLEYRQPSGTFDNFSASDPAVNGVLLRITDGGKGQTRLLDCTPDTWHYADSPCPVGTTFVDPLNGTSITVDSVSAAGAVVTVGNSINSNPSPSATPKPSATPTPTPSPTATPTSKPSATPTSTPSATPAPTSPTAPVVSGGVTHRHKASLTWTTSVSNVPITRYNIYRNGKLVTHVGPSTIVWKDGWVLNHRKRTYYLIAVDKKGHTSHASNSIVLIY